MANEVEAFYKLIRLRSVENVLAFKLLYENKLYGTCIAILRLELDSYVRVLFIEKQLPRLKGIFIGQTLNGINWSYTNEKGKKVCIRDKDLIEFASKFIAWDRNVYKFGCSFIHLSNMHDYRIIDPFSKLSLEEKNEIIEFIQHYQHVDLSSNLSMNSIIPVLPDIMEKISANLACKMKSFVE